jgi:hypothetical protein
MFGASKHGKGQAQSEVKWKKIWHETKKKLENLGLNKKFYLKLFKLHVPHLLQEHQHNEYIHENLKQKH